MGLNSRLETGPLPSKELQPGKVWEGEEFEGEPEAPEPEDAGSCSECGKGFEGPVWFDELLTHWRVQHPEELRERLAL